MPPAVGENIPTAGGLTIYRGITLLFRSLNRRSLNNKLHASIHSICLTTVRSISAFIRIQRLNPIQYISQIILKGTLQLAGTSSSNFFVPSASSFAPSDSSSIPSTTLLLPDFRSEAPLAREEVPFASVELRSPE